MKQASTNSRCNSAKQIRFNPQNWGSHVKWYKFSMAITAAAYLLVQLRRCLVHHPYIPSNVHRGKCTQIWTGSSKLTGWAESGHLQQSCNVLFQKNNNPVTCSLENQYRRMSFGGLKLMGWVSGVAVRSSFHIFIVLSASQVTSLDPLTS